MTIGRSFGRIVWCKEILGFQMVNADCKQFFIYADPLINVFGNPDRYVRVKRRTLRSGGEYYPGEIYGSVDETRMGKEPFSKLSLYFGSADRRIKLRDTETETELLEAIEVQEYLFPEEELAGFVRSIEAMRAQRDRFEMLLRGTEFLFP